MMSLHHHGLLFASPGGSGTLDRFFDGGPVSLLPSVLGLNALDAPAVRRPAHVVGVNRTEHVVLAVWRPLEQMLSVHCRSADGSIWVIGVKSNDMVSAQVLGGGEAVQCRRDRRDKVLAGDRAGWHSP